MFAQREEAHNAANRCSRGRLADTAVRVRVRWLRGVLSVVRVFIGSGVPVHVSCATGSPDTRAGVLRCGSADE